MDDKTSPSATKSKLDTAKQKLGALAEKAKQHDFKGDARKAAEGVKDLKENLKKHNFKAELKEAFAEAKKNPASIWKKPEPPRPGKDLAVVGLAAAVGSFLITAVTSSSFLGLLCLLLGLGALLFSLLGLKTEGRKMALGGMVVGLLVVFSSLGQMFGSSTDGKEDTEKKIATSTMRKETLGNNGKSKADEEYPLLIPNEGEKASSVNAILEMAENARRIRSLNFCGFYTGMSCKNAKLLCQHYGLDKDDFEFSFNHQSGEVFAMKFSTRAIGLILDVANNFETTELAVQECLGIVAWNNEKEVEKGQVNSILQDEGEKMVLGDAADVARWYETADGVVVKMFPKVWNRPGKTVFSIWDPRRGKDGKAVNKIFDHNSKMRQDRLDLVQEGCKTKMLKLPRGYECLLMESSDDADCGCWMIAFSFTEKLRAEIFDEPETDKKELDLVEGMKAAFEKGAAERKEAEKWEGEWKEYEKKAEDLKSSGKAKAEIRAMGYGLDHETWIKVQNVNKIVNSLNSLPAESKGNLTFESKPTSNGKVVVIASTPEQIEARKEKMRKAVEVAKRQEEEVKRQEEEAKRQEEEARRKAEEAKRMKVQKAAEQLKANPKAFVDGVVASMVSIPGKNYRMGKYEVSQAQWMAVMGNNPSRFAGADNPVENVSWNDCQEFLKKLNALPEMTKLDLVFRLPTDAEWKYACRAGTTGKYCKLANGTEITIGTLEKVAWFINNSNEKTHPVGQKEPNAYGLYDMHGNVWEWCLEEYGEVASSAKGTDHEHDRVNHGGSCFDSSENCVFSIQNRGSSDYRRHNCGFRLCASGRAEEAQRKAKEAERKEMQKTAEQLKADPKAFVDGVVASMVSIPGKDYRMGKYEVIQSQWEAVMGTNPSKFRGVDNPVENVSWNDCQEFLEKFNALPEVKKSGLVFRLPTDAEWEYACLAGATGKYCKLADGTEITSDTLGKAAWIDFNSDNKAHPVGQKKPNAYGLYDMHGNVQEWTQTAHGKNRVSCGGSWNLMAWNCDSSNRGGGSPEYRRYDLGFRLCATGGEPPAEAAR